MATLPSTTAAFARDERLSALTFRGAGLRAEVAEAVIGSPTVSLAIDEVTQVQLTVVDPGLPLAFGGYIRIGSLLMYEDLRLIVSRLEISGGPAGTGQITVTARSELVRNLKQRRGPMVMRNRSPSQFVAAETTAAGGRSVVQQSAGRSSVSRDVPVAGQSQEGSEYPSSWTTFQRLADEQGFLLFEIGNVIYFGQASWIMSRVESTQPIRVGWVGEPEATRALAMPQCTRTEDAPMDREVTLELPHTRSAEVRPGKGLELVGMPWPFAGRYIVSRVETQLSGSTPLTVTAISPKNALPTVGPDLSKARARAGAPRLEESRIAQRAPNGSLLLQFINGVAVYGDGTVIDGKGVQPAKLPMLNADTGGAAATGGGVAASGGTTAGGVVASGGGNLNVFISKALAQAGNRYVWGAEARLNDPDPRAFDCSELVQWAAAQAGVSFVDGSQAQRAACRRAGRIISVAQATRTRGALLFTSGHVAISLGDGRTIEARNSRVGVVVGKVPDIRYAEGGLIPGLRYG